MVDNHVILKQSQKTWVAIPMLVCTPTLDWQNEQVLMPIFMDRHYIKYATSEDVAAGHLQDWGGYPQRFPGASSPL